MYLRVILIFLICLLINSCQSIIEDNIIEVNPNLTIRPAKRGVELLLDEFDLETMKVVQNATHLKWQSNWYNNEQVGNPKDYSIKFINYSNQKDDLLTLSIPSKEVFASEYKLYRDFTYAFNMVITNKDDDTIAYVPDEVLNVARVLLERSLKNKDYVGVNQILSSAITFYPIFKEKSNINKEIIGLRSLAKQSMENLYLSYEDQARASFTPSIEVTEKIKFEDYERWHLKYLVDKDEYGFAYLLIPLSVIQSNNKTSLIICPHPTYYGGKDRVVGVYYEEPENSTEANTREMRSYALDLVKKGFITFAPDKPAYGERRLNINNKDFLEEQRLYSEKLREKYPKWGLNGKTVYDLKIALDYLIGFPFIDENSIGCIGHSLGAWDTLLFSSLDERVKAAVCSSGGMLTYQKELWRNSEFLKTYLTGNKNGNLNINTNIFYMLIASRPFLSIYSVRDPNYNDEVLQLIDGYRDVIEYYKKVNGTNRSDFSYYLNSDGHDITPTIKALMYEWLSAKIYSN